MPNSNCWSCKNLRDATNEHGKSCKRLSERGDHDDVREWLYRETLDLPVVDGGLTGANLPMGHGWGEVPKDADGCPGFSAVDQSTTCDLPSDP